MSKRTGTYVTLRDLVEWVGRDAARFFLVSRKSDAEFVFDVNLALSQSDENPVYYLQYAHARICSIFNQAREKGFVVPTEEQAAQFDLSVLESAQATALANRMSDYGKTLSIAARDLAPHLICVYLKDLAADFHAFYNSDRVLVEDETVRNARLALLLATRRVLANGLAVLGVSAPERMDSKKE
jgi:arginyl-tRNA synthetase